MAKARTGSGKTGAYCIPLIEKILQAKHSDLKQVRSLDKKYK